MPDTLLADFAIHLEEIHAQSATPRDEMDALWQIGLEREAIVTVAYRRDIIEHRLGRMPIDPNMRALAARAIRWTWRDEEAHTLWVRGALLRRGHLADRVRARVIQAEGRIGGWVASRQAHFRWREAPLRRLVAEVVEAAGVATGRIPAAVRGNMHWNTFRDVCRFNVQAERTAALSWRRMAELARDPATRAHPDEGVAFAHMAEDEDRHARIFEILGDAFDATDHVADGWTAARLHATLASVGQRFVAVPDAAAPAWRNPLGKGGVVVVRDGADLEATLAAALDAAGLAAILDQHRPPGRPPRVAIKTTFMLVAHRADPSPGVSPAVIGGIAGWLADRGADVDVIDARNIYDRFHQHRSVRDVAGYLGISGPFRIVDAEQDQAPHPFLRGLGADTISRAWRDADVRIVLGKLRSHPTTAATLTIDAAEGLGLRHDDALFGDRQTERDTAVMMALDAFPPHLAVLDAWENVPDGLLGMMGTDNPLQPRRIYASTDAVALDVVAARHVGADPDLAMARAAIDWFGDPSANVRIDGPDTAIHAFRTPDHQRRSTLLSLLANPVFTHASGRGALFLPTFDEAAFPPVGPVGPALHAARAVVRRIVEDDSTAPTQDVLPTWWQMINGAAVRFARLGTGSPVVLLHGYPDNLQLFARLATALSARHAVFAFDWPGLGHSAPWSGSASPADLAERLRIVLDAWGLDRVDLVAHDMGGPPALLFAERYPARVGRVVVMNSLLFGDADTSWEIALMRRAGLAGAAFAWAPTLVYERCKATFLPAGDDLPAHLDADLYGAFHHRGVRERLAAMCRDYDAALPDLPDLYWKIDRPVHLLWAGADGHFPVDHAERMRTLVKGASLDVLPNARHWMAWSRSLEVSSKILPLLAEGE